MDILNTIRCVDCLEGLRSLESLSVNMVVTSPPYYNLRDYGVEGQVGCEDTPEEYVNRLGDIFDEVRRVLVKDGTVWLNVGDTYAGGGRGGGTETQQSNKGSLIGRNVVPDGLKQKDLMGIPWRVAFELQRRGWYLRQDIIWAKPNPMPESVTDRCTKSHEYIFLLSKSKSYYFDHEAIAEPVAESTVSRLSQNVDDQDGSMRVPGKNKPMKAVGNGETRNKRSVWTVPVKGTSFNHFATYPEELIVPCILAGSKPGDVVLDPFMGIGTTALVAKRLLRKYIGFDLNEESVGIANERLKQIELFD